MQNPIQGIRQQLKEQAGVAPENVTPKSNSVETSPPDIIKELHVGWLDHPVTLNRLQKLQEELSNLEMTLKLSSLQKDTSDSYLRGLLMTVQTYKEVLHILKNI